MSNRYEVSNEPPKKWVGVQVDELSQRINPVILGIGSGGGGDGAADCGRGRGNGLKTVVVVVVAVIETAAVGARITLKPRFLLWV